MNNVFSKLAPAVALCLPLLALAQAGRPDPADPKAAALAPAPKASEPEMPAHGGHQIHGGPQ